MTIKEVFMPSLGESVTEAAVVQWLVKSGEQIARYQPLMEVVSDKVTTEIPSDYNGIVKDFLVELDQDVPIGTALMTLEVAGESTETAVVEQEVQVTEAIVESGDAAKRYSPAVLKLAQEKGVDLEKVIGTGKDGRITRKDVLNYQATDSVAEKVAEATVQVEIQEESVKAPVATSKGTPVKESPILVDKIVKADGTRKAIAQKMVQSVTEIPHAWVMVEVDVSNIVKLRNEAKAAFQQKEGFSLSFFPFFAKAVVQALKNNPKLNTSWENNQIIYHKDINLSIAVTTEEALYVPVIKQADNYSLVGLAKEINQLATSVREGSFANITMAGGTFTLNNTASIGSVQSMGIINYPQAAILQVESITKRVVPTEDGAIKIADMVNLCLSIDHRILDGYQAGMFLKDIKANLAKFETLADLY